MAMGRNGKIIEDQAGEHCSWLDEGASSEGLSKQTPGGGRIKWSLK